MLDCPTSSTDASRTRQYMIETMQRWRSPPQTMEATAMAIGFDMI